MKRGKKEIISKEFIVLGKVALLGEGNGCIRKLPSADQDIPMSAG